MLQFSSQEGEQPEEFLAHQQKFMAHHFKVS